MSPKTRFEQVFDEQMKNPKFAKAYKEAKVKPNNFGWGAKDTGKRLPPKSEFELEVMNVIAKKSIEAVALYRALQLKKQNKNASQAFAILVKARTDAKETYEAFITRYNKHKEQL